MNAVYLSDVIVNVRSLLLIFGNASDTRIYFEQIKNVSPFPIFVWPHASNAPTSATNLLYSIAY